VSEIRSERGRGRGTGRGGGGGKTERERELFKEVSFYAVSTSQISQKKITGERHAKG
jgi:hypothetical protein